MNFDKLHNSVIRHWFSPIALIKWAVVLVNTEKVVDEHGENRNQFMELLKDKASTDDEHFEKYCYN